MNAKDSLSLLPDVQGSADARRMLIQAAGVRAVRYPLSFLDPTLGHEPCASVAVVTMSVAVPAEQRGAHMSRFLETLHAHRRPMDVPALQTLAREMLARLEATTGSVSFAFPVFREKKAPVTGAPSLLDYSVTLTVTTVTDDMALAQSVTTVSLLVPVTSLCPCSRDISLYGAHNQRSHVTVTIEALDLPGLGDLADLVESCASSQLYGVLKRPDEKFVTERAYDNPKFVEDLARDVAMGLERDTRVLRYRVDVENFEAIHNHSAFAVIEGPQPRIDRS